MDIIRATPTTPKPVAIDTRKSEHTPLDHLMPKNEAPPPLTMKREVYAMERKPLIDKEERSKSSAEGICVLLCCCITGIFCCCVLKGA